MSFLDEYTKKAEDKIDQRMAQATANLKRHWLKIAALAYSATRTFDIVRQTSPDINIFGYLIPIVPIASVLFMEGGVYWWQEALDEAKNKTQSKIAVIWYWITLVSVLLTIVADAAYQAAQHELFPGFTMPTWAGWIAILSTVFVAILHVAGSWFYRKSDPDVELAREEESAIRIQREIENKTKSEVKIKRLQTKAAFFIRSANKMAQVEGKRDYEREFEEMYGIKPGDVDPDLSKPLTPDQEKEVAILFDSSKKSGNGHSRIENVSVTKEPDSESGANFTSR